MDLATLLIALATATSNPSVPPTTTPATAPPAPAPVQRITRDSVWTSLNSLLRDEGLAQVRSNALTSIHAIDLDGDASTEEALVDVIAPETCDPAGQCETLVVRALPCGRLVALGHGRWLRPLASRSEGWMDLGETQTTLFSGTVVVRALRWRTVRYV